MNISTKKDTIIDEIQSIKVADPYRWLEDSKNPEVEAWINQQNASLYADLKNVRFNEFSSELVNNFKVVNFSNPRPVNGKYFYTERQPDEDQSVLYMKEGLSGNPVKIFDPNGKRHGNTVNIDYWFESKTGRYVAYGVSEGGDEMSTLYIKDTSSNQELKDKIIHCRYSQVRWLPDDSGFFYLRNARPGTIPKNEESMHVKVYFHKIGDNPEEDMIVFGEGRPKEDMIRIHLSLDGRYLAIQISKTWSEQDIYIYDADKKEIKPLVEGIPSKFSVIFLKDKVLLYTNFNANNYRILQNSYEYICKPVSQWKEFIAEKEYLLESIHVTKSKILVGYLVNVCSEVIVHNYDGKQIEKIPLPKYSSLEGISARREEEEFFYGVDSFTFPKIVYRYDPVEQKYLEYRRTTNPIYPDKYEIKQEWAVSADGVRVPYFIFHKKGIILNSGNPTILYGYGGFAVNLNPVFMRNWIPWIERGGVFVTANIRGGGEFGKKWHIDGIKDKKQNSFNDFIAVSEHLIASKYTSREHLGIIGGSNGGLLVSAVAVQRPQLYKAVCSRVPLTDMVRFPLFGIATRWTHEYGDPQKKEDLERILKWSPYHNVKENINYPNFLFTTANKDSRVDPLHARKMAAFLQGVSKENKVYILTEMEAGHGPGKPVAKIVESQALVLTFFAENLDL